jgi:hypothetical protein
MLQSNNSFPVGKPKNIVRARITVTGIRPLLQHAFGPDAIPLEKQEKEGVAGNNPGEWKKSCLVTDKGQLYILGSYVYGAMRDAAVHTKKGRGSIMKDVEATLQVEEAVILLDRFMPKGEPTRDPTALVYLDVRGVVNKATKGRNVRYRLAASPGWTCTFTLTWDKTIVDRNQMKAVILDAGRYCGLGDGLRIGCGKFQVASYEELDADAEDETSEGTVAEAPSSRLGEGRQKVRAVPEVAEVDGVSH